MQAVEPAVELVPATHTGQDGDPAPIVLALVPAGQILQTVFPVLDV